MLEHVAPDHLLVMNFGTCHTVHVILHAVIDLIIERNGGTFFQRFKIFKDSDLLILVYTRSSQP